MLLPSDLKLMHFQIICGLKILQGIPSVYENVHSIFSQFLIKFKTNFFVSIFNFKGTVLFKIELSLRFLDLPRGPLH